MKYTALGLALALALGLGYVGHGPAERPVQTTGWTPEPGETVAVTQPPEGDPRAEQWQTAEELGLQPPEGVLGGFYIPSFLTYRGGFYGGVGDEKGLRFAPSGEEDLLFNVYYTHEVYWVEDHPDWIAVHINGMEVYQKIFDVTFELDGVTYAIAYSPAMEADYTFGEAVLETEDFTVYEAVKLQGEPAQTKEYLVDLLPLLQRERPALFDGSRLEPGGWYATQWQIALPLN